MQNEEIEELGSKRIYMAYLEPRAHVNKWELPHSILLPSRPCSPAFCSFRNFSLVKDLGKKIFGFSKIDIKFLNSVLKAENLERLK